MSARYLRKVLKEQEQERPLQIEEEEEEDHRNGNQSDSPDFGTRSSINPFDLLNDQDGPDQVPLPRLFIYFIFKFLAIGKKCYYYLMFYDFIFTRIIQTDVLPIIKK